MADNTYVINTLTSNGWTVTVSDDGSGSDWLVMGGLYGSPTEIDLSWTATNGTSTSAEGIYYVGTSGSRLIVNGLIENAKGSNGQDFIQGNEVANILYGDSASTGGGAADTLWGADGNDTIYGGDGNDGILGDAGNDWLQGDAGSDTISGGSGVDTVLGGIGADNLSGGSDARDMVSYRTSGAAVAIQLTFGATTTANTGGDAQGDWLYGFMDAEGSAFNDTITDTVVGTVAYGGNANRFYGRDGNDVLNMGGGADSAYGGNGNDKLYGGAEGDSLDGGTGSDTMIGGEGGDIYVCDAATDVISETGTTGRDKVVSAVNWTLGSTLEDLTLTGTATIGHGNTGNNVLNGNTLGNTLDGHAGNDTIRGGAGNDSLIGSTGNDSLDGGTGSDTMVGGDGSDIYVCDAATDVISETGATGRDKVVSSVSWTLGSTLEDLTLTGITAIRGNGNGAANVLTGNGIGNTMDAGGGNDTVQGGAGNDSILGNTGDDRIDGGAGNDTMNGGTGNDTFLCDSSADVIIEAVNQGTDSVISSVSWTLGATLENLTLTGTTAVRGNGNGAANVLTGNGIGNTMDAGGGNDTVQGGAGNDTMSGSTGADRLNGGAGADSLTGGADADTFVFVLTSDSTAAARDTITDFSHAQADRIDLSAIDAKAGGATNDAFSLITTGFTGHAGELRVQSTTGGVLVQADVNGDKAADLVIFVAGVSNLVAADFIL